MKYHIDTIPLWDAYKSDCECPLCEIQRKCELDFLDVFMGGSVMEPSRRVEVNEKGFCTRHFDMMFNAGNRLGLALMTHTYLKRTMEKLEETAALARAHADEHASTPLPKRIMGKNAALKSVADDARHVHEIASSCLFCEKLDESMRRYEYTLLHMWKHESEFRAAFNASKGLCLPHCSELMLMAADELSGKELNEFICELTALQKTNLERLEKEVEWFTLKFDYRNADKPWGTSQDAIERALTKLRGYAAAEEPKKD